VSHVLTGSVRRAGNALRVSVELVEARADTPIWSDKYTGTVEDVFGIQDEIAAKIVTALEVTLSESERRQAAERPIADTAAYDCYLRARQHMYGWMPDSTERALREVDSALAIAGDLPLLLATKAQLYWNELNMGLVPPDVALPRAAEVVERALALDPDHPLAIFVRGLIAGSRGRQEEALPDLYRAHDLWPGDANILLETCRFSNTAGLRHFDALVERLQLIDPLSALTPMLRAGVLWANGHFEDAVAPGHRACELTEPGSRISFLIGMFNAPTSREEARALLEPTTRVMAGTAFGDAASFLYHALAGDREGALRFATPRLAQTLRNEVDAVLMAEGYMMIQRAEDALGWIRHAIDHGFINYPFLTEHDPFLADLRDDRRLIEMMEEVKPRWEKVIEWEERLG